MIEDQGGLIVSDNIVIASQKYEKPFNFPDAELYCSLLEIDGYTDWRIPTKEQFFIVSKKFDSLKIIPENFKFKFKRYWTSSEYYHASNNHDNQWLWMQNMHSHSQSSTHRMNSNLFVRPFRLC